jgi:hypothetical protein
MDYNHITTFLDKFKKLIFQKEKLKEVIAKTISEEISHQTDGNLIKIKDDNIYIQGSPILRNEVLMHKKQILDKLKNILPNNNFSDIK